MMMRREAAWLFHILILPDSLPTNVSRIFRVSMNSSRRGFVYPNCHSITRPRTLTLLAEAGQHGKQNGTTTTGSIDQKTWHEPGGHYWIKEIETGLPVSVSHKHATQLPLISFGMMRNQESFHCCFPTDSYFIIQMLSEKAGKVIRLREEKWVPFSSIGQSIINSYDYSPTQNVGKHDGER